MVVGLTIKTNVKITGKRLFLPETYREYAGELMDLFAKQTLKAIKYRAPKDTGNLKRNIKLDNKGKKSLIRSINVNEDNVPYFEAVNKGFTPHWIPYFYYALHKSSPGMRSGRIPHSAIKPLGGWFKSVPNYNNIKFLERGLEAGKRDFNKYVDEAFNKTIKSKGR